MNSANDFDLPPSYINIKKTIRYEIGGSMAVAESGEETWTPPDGAVPSSTAPLSTRFNQSRIAFSGSDAQAQIGAEIDALLCKPPGAWYVR